MSERWSLRYKMYCAAWLLFVAADLVAILNHDALIAGALGVVVTVWLVYLNMD